MFEEIVDVAHVAQEVIEAAGPSVGMWPSFYQLYREIDEVIDCAGGAAYLLDPPAHLFAHSDDTTARYVMRANCAFERLDQVVQRMIGELSGLSRCLQSALPNAASALRLRHNLHPKSAWYIQFSEDFCSGRVAADGASVERFALRLHPAPPRRLMWTDMEDPQLEVRETIDISTQQLRHALAERSKASVRGLQSVRDALGDFLRANCTIDDLLVPARRR
jgi:hypothetical protein